LATVPIGYGDGIRRGLSGNADVLVGGRRRPLVGTVSMDNLTVALGADEAATALRGTPVVLIGSQGQERILAEELAARLSTINYEIVCGLTGRVPRIYHRDGELVDA
jgi:alanine racemase